MRKVFLVFLVSMLFASFVHAADHGTAKEAIALMKKAMAYYQENGQEKALNAFKDKKGPFMYKDLYITLMDFNGNILVHGAGALTKKSVYDLRDPDGKLFIRDLITVAKTKGTGWVDYKWTHPGTKKIQRKSTYVQRIPGHDLLLGCGIYK